MYRSSFSLTASKNRIRKKKLCWLLLFGSSPFFGFCVLCSFRVCVCVVLPTFFLDPPFFLVCWMDQESEKKKGEIQLHDDCHICTILFLLHNSAHFFFFLGEKIFFLFFRASLVNASRRDHHQWASSAATTGTYSLFHSGPITNSWNHFFFMI
jgi:hypothetical protein